MWKQCQTFFGGAPKSLQMVTAAMTLKGTYSLEEKLTNLAKSLQSCLTLCNPMDGTPLVSSVPGILQARILEWVAISFSRGSSPGIEPASPALASRVFTIWAIWEANEGPSSQSYGFSSGCVWMWELDYKESWVLKNWCFWTMVLEKTLDNPLDCKEIKPVHRKGNQSWIFIGRTDVEAEISVLWPTDARSWLTGKDPDAGKDWRWEEKGMTEYEMVGWHHQLNGHDFE